MTNLDVSRHETSRRAATIGVYASERDSEEHDEAIAWWFSRSTIVTSTSAPANALATLSPPNPPPTTTT